MQVALWMLSLFCGQTKSFKFISPRPTGSKSITTSSRQALLLAMTHKLQFDGGSRGNPGIGGSGSVIYDVGSGKVVWKGYHFLGMSVTNNQAEYAGLIEGLKAAVALKISSLEIEGDSELVVRQMTGEYKVKNARLIVLQKKAQDLVTKIPEHSFKSIPRSLNAEADQLSNMAMDTRKSESMLYKVS